MRSINFNCIRKSKPKHQPPLPGCHRVESQPSLVLWHCNSERCFGATTCGTKRGRWWGHDPQTTIEDRRRFPQTRLEISCDRIRDTVAMYKVMNASNLLIFSGDRGLGRIPAMLKKEALKPYQNLYQTDSARMLPNVTACSGFLGKTRKKRARNGEKRAIPTLASIC